MKALKFLFSDYFKIITVQCSSQSVDHFYQVCTGNTLKYTGKRESNQAPVSNIMNETAIFLLKTNKIVCDRLDVCIQKTNGGVWLKLYENLNIWVWI